MAVTDIVRKGEKFINDTNLKRFRKKGWVSDIHAYTGFGSSKRLHVVGCVLLENPEHDESKSLAQRGFRQFMTIQVPQHPVTVTVNGASHSGTTDDDGYFDLVIFDHGLAPGWHEVEVKADNAQTVTTSVQVVADDVQFGIVSDIDDTILVTWLPRALIAAWNSWIKRTDRRRPVPGMSRFFAELEKRYPGSPVFYLSTGAWNTFHTLSQFMEKHGFPKGAMLLTDWGPTETNLFRSGQEHKKVQLRNLMIDFPDMKWILIGDDGQHDPLIYSDVVKEHPRRVHFVALRTLSAQEHVLAHGTATPLADTERNARELVPFIQGHDGDTLRKKLDHLDDQELSS
ncbi:MAG: phosphatase domain-containing protein [Corynebacterium sp.]|nr:phosphatase domain-containing protein [Corynebacterium sp.]